MKQFKLFAVALAALTMFSCQKQEEPGASDVEAGIPTTATIFLNQTSTPATRATTLEAATADEQAIKSATIYIFNATNVLEKTVPFGTDDLTSKKKVINITAGKKLVYATVNIPGAQLTDIKDNETSRTAFEQKVLNIVNIADATNATTGFWMTNNDNGAAVTLNPGIATPTPGNNTVTVNVGRATAKVSVTLIPNVPVIGGAFTLSDFRVKDSPKQSYLMPAKNAEGKRISPNYSKTAITSADYVHGPFVTIATTPSTYAMENINESPRHGNTSYVLIKGVFTPTTTLDTNGANPEKGVVAADYWRIQKADKSLTADYYRAAPTQAEIIAKGGVGAKTLPYAGGLSFYSLYIGDNTKTDLSEKYAVLRNNFYKIKIIQINGGGWNDETGALPGTPGEPIETSTNIEATIAVLPWNVIDQSGAI